MGMLQFRAYMPYIVCSLVSISIAEDFNGWEERVVAPPRWPDTFHASIVQTRKGVISTTDLYYDFPNGRSVNIIKNQLSRVVLYDNERLNGSAYYYDHNGLACTSVDMHVAMLKPDWLSGSTYAGLHEVGGFEVDCWQQGRAPPPYSATTPFLTYCSRKDQQREPVRWVFFDGSSFDVLSWDLGDTPPYGAWNIPRVCFVDSALAPWEGGGGGWGEGETKPLNQKGGGKGVSSGGIGLKGSAPSRNNGFGGARNSHKAASHQREGGITLDALVHAARGLVPEGEKGTILTTIANDRLMLAAMSAAVEYQRRMLMDPHLKKKKKTTRVVKVNTEKPIHSGTEKFEGIGDEYTVGREREGIFPQVQGREDFNGFQGGFSGGGGRETERDAYMFQNIPVGLLRNP